MKIEENSRFSLPHDKKVLKLKSVSFHPVQNKLAVAFRRDIYGMIIVSFFHQN